MVSILLNGEMYEVEPAVKAYIEQLEEKNNYLLEKIQSFYKNEKLDLIDRGRFLRELNDEIDEYAECRMAVTADALLDFIEEFEPITEGELVARLSELEEENARLKELYQKSVGVISATDCVECKDKSVKHGRWESCCNLMGEYFKCSECGYKAEVPTCMGEPIFIYCPNCGAKMDLKDGESE